MLSELKYAVFIFVLFNLLNCTKAEKENQNLTEKDESIINLAVEAAEAIDNEFAERTAEYDSITPVELGKIRLVSLNFYPSFAESHGIIIHPEDRYILFAQTSNRMRYRPVESSVSTVDPDEYNLEMQKLHSSKNFISQINKNEIDEILDRIKDLKRENYKSVSAEVMDGVQIEILMIENDSVISIHTNSPTIAQQKFIEKILSISENHMSDSVTLSNIDYLKEK